MLIKSVLDYIFNNRLKSLDLHLFGIYIHINQNMEEFQNCSKCFQSSQDFLALKCSHNLCLPCAAKLTKRLLKFKNAAFNNICCQVCGKYSYLSQETIRSLVGEHDKQDLKQKTSMKRGQINIQQVSLYCFTCHAKCFSIDQYLAGSHKAHDVRNVRKAYQSLRLLLQSSLQKVKGKVDQTLSDVSKITILKRNCLQQLGEAKKKIKLNFGKIKKIIEEKEMQLQKESQEHANKNLQQLQRNILTIQNLGEALQQTELKIKERLCKETPTLQEIIDSFNFYSKERESLLQRLKLADSFNHEQFFKKIQFGTFNLDLILQKYQNLKAIQFNLLQEKESSLHCSFIQQTKDSFKSARNPKNSLAKTVSSPSLRQDLESAKNISQMFKNFRERQLTGRCQRISQERTSASPICMPKKDFKQNRNGRLDQRISKLRKLIQS